ncbi:unannotated protein [freshwater metagenome]|uniref:Unannotated protein n=1 Tax=freshwater metagenome TaxID=449393 RepID=A0A6J6PE71_9ZZZZ
MRSNDALLPSNSIDSNNGGETVLPVTAIRTEPKAMRGLRPNSSMRDALSAASIVS